MRTSVTTTWAPSLANRVAIAVPIDMPFTELNRLLELAIAGEKTEGGTMLVPGHGRISDEADLVEYRDMVTIIRDRVQDMVNRGLTLEQVQAARPTMEYDGLYGSAPGWSTAQFVQAVYRGLRPQRPAAR